MRVLVVLINTILMFWNPVLRLPLGDFRLYDMVLIVIGVTFFGVFFYEMLRLTRLLRDIDEGKIKEK